MTSIDNSNKFKSKWWLHPMDPENLVELSDSDKKNAKNYNRWLLIWGVMFFCVVNIMEPLPGGIEVTPVWRWLLAFSPLVSGIFFVRAFVRFFTEVKDDLIRNIHYKALAIGFVSAFFIGMCFALSAVIFGSMVFSGPLMFTGLIAGYFISLTLSYRKHNV